MKTVLVTGGAGFIGSNFVRYLLDRYDYRILVLDNLTYAGTMDNLPPAAPVCDRLEFWQGDVCNAALVDQLVRQADIVVHMAAETHVTRSIFDNRLFFETDVIGTQTVATAVVKHRSRIERFIHISTSEVYGTAESDTMDESHPLNPMSPYAAAKCGADRLVYSYWMTYAIPAIIVRPFNTYGPYQHLEKVVPRFVTSCLLGEQLTIHGDGSPARDWLYVSDHCCALDLALHADIQQLQGRAINIGTGRHLSIMQIAEMVAEAMGVGEDRLTFVGDRPGQVFRHTCDANRARELLGWSPRVCFEEGLQQTIRWYTDNRAWWTPQLRLRHIPIMTAGGRWEMH